MNGLGHAGIPDKKFVVVAARGQVLVVGRPFETTYFLSMPNKSSFWKKEKHWLKLLYCSSFLDWSLPWHSIVSSLLLLQIREYEYCNYLILIVGNRLEVCGLKWFWDTQYLASSSNDSKLFERDSSMTQPVHTTMPHKKFFAKGQILVYPMTI